MSSMRSPAHHGAACSEAGHRLCWHHPVPGSGRGPQYLDSGAPCGLNEVRRALIARAGSVRSTDAAPAAAPHASIVDAGPIVRDAAAQACCVPAAAHQSYMAASGTMGLRRMCPLGQRLSTCRVRPMSMRSNFTGVARVTSQSSAVRFTTKGVMDSTKLYTSSSVFHDSKRRHTHRARSLPRWKHSRVLPAAPSSGSAGTLAAAAARRAFSASSQSFLDSSSAVTRSCSDFASR
mmetsp:Transcript_2667/g.7846  ORF Transcript_2667/g.7846 Transcript_2667/m.7846 type:complete len:234 (+) Transcript_2667:260-961(+)